MQSASDPRPTVSAVVTSCRRFDLLEQTLVSFLEHNDYPLDELIVIEDSDDEGIYGIERVIQGVKHRIILNGKNIGQIASIDKAYAEITSDYIFHMEDDWLFTERGFIARAVEVLQQESDAVIVCVRDDADMPRYLKSLRTRKAGAASYKRVYPAVHYLWHTFTFNPGLRRTEDYRALGGGYAAIGDEADISRYYKRLERDMIWLLGGGVCHTGDTRSNYGSGWGYRKPMSSFSLARFFRRENVSKWSESLRRRFWHNLRRLGVDTEALQRRKSR